MLCEILESFSRMDGLCGKAMTCNSMTQVKKYITSLERCVLKAPWSGSGRGIMYVPSKDGMTLLRDGCRVYCGCRAKLW